MNCLNKTKTNGVVVYSCRYYIVWCSKYKRKILIEDVEKKLKEIIQEVSEKNNVEIIEIEVYKDHIHILCDIDPQFGVNKFVKLVKSISSKILRKEFPNLKKKLPTLWSNSYFVATVGSASFESINQYIENQQTSERDKEKNKWKIYLNNLISFKGLK